MGMARQTIQTLADEIRRRWPGLRVEVSRGFASTDRKIAGTRLRHPGKGRTGARIQVFDATPGNTNRGALEASTWLSPRKILDHNQAETYRTTDDVRRWIDERVAAEKKARRRRLT
jgi:hypothetical protein